MRILATIGRLLFAVAITVFGIQHLIYARTAAGLGPPWAPVNHVLAYIVGALLLVAGICLAIGRQVQFAAILLAIVLLARAALNDLPKLIFTPRDPGPWTSGFELLALCGACLVIAAILGTRRSYSGRAVNPVGPLFKVGQLLFAVALVIFGIQHMMYAKFIATLIPAWIPGHLFWAYFVGAAFLASALAIATTRLATLAASLLGLMFFLWVVILHAPRVVGALHNGNEWTSMIVALAMSGGAFAIAGGLAERNS